MGITQFHAEMIVREHKQRKLPETVHLLGRQTVLLTFGQAIELLKRSEVEPTSTPVEVDQQTLGAHATQQAFISDRTFFGLMGVKKVLAIDYSDYEGAEIILDLTKPVPASHRDTVDFLFGGSVLDNIFDPATYLKNISELLRPGGRLLEQDIISQHYHPYCLVTPGWMLDYFVVNAYASCSVYVGELSPRGFAHMYGVDPDPDDFVSDFGPPRGGISIGIVVVAEKGPSSSSGIAPIQDQYRNDDDKANYRKQIIAMKQTLNFFEFAQPTPLELCRLGKRSSKSLRYLGVFRPLGANPEASPSDGGPIRGLRIYSATYGGNWIGNELPKPGVCAAYSGNVTEILAGLFNGGQRAEWVVDVNVLGDPVPGCGKDLEVIYANLSEPQPRLLRAYIPAEASGRSLSLPSSGEGHELS
jgi:hypothetical protein